MVESILNENTAINSLSLDRSIGNNIVIQNQAKSNNL